MPSKKELEEMVAGLQAQLEEKEVVKPSEVSADELQLMKSENKALSDRVEQLTFLMLANKAQKDEPISEEKITIRNACGSVLGFSVTDVTGRPRRVKLGNKGDSAMLTTTELAEAKEKSPHYFDNGWVSVDGEESDNPNLIPDIGVFLRDIPAENIKARVEQITSVTTLTSIFNYIETLRFSEVDSVEGEGEDAVRTLEENDNIDPKFIAVELAVQRHLAKMHGVRLSMDDN